MELVFDLEVGGSPLLLDLAAARDVVADYLEQHGMSGADVEDVAAAAVLHLWTRVGSGDPPQDPRAYLLSLARDWLAQAGEPGESRSPEPAPARPSPPGSPATELEEAHGHLPAAYQQILAWVREPGLPRHEIAARLGVSVGSVGVLIDRAQAALRAAVGKARPPQGSGETGPED